MVRTNPNVSQFFGVIRQELIKNEDNENMISAQITGRSINMMNFTKMVEKLRYQFKQTQKDKETRHKNGGPIQVNILYNKSQKDIGVLIKLNSLMKRLELIKFL